MIVYIGSGGDSCLTLGWQFLKIILKLFTSDKRMGFNLWILSGEGKNIYDNFNSKILYFYWTLQKHDNNFCFLLTYVNLLSQ